MNQFNEIQQALTIALKEEERAHGLVVMLQTFVALEQGTARIQAEKEQAEENRDDAIKELARLNSQIGQLQGEVNLAVDRQSARIEEESKRVQAPLQKVKDELRTFRAKAQNDREQLNRQIHDLEATKAGLEGTLKKLESNIRARQNEAKALEAEMTGTRDSFTIEKRNMERELASMGDTAQIKDEIRLARAAAQKEKEALQQEIRELRLTKERMTKIDRTARV